MDERTTWSPTWRTMDKVSWSPGIFFRPPLLGDHDYYYYFFSNMIDCKANSRTNSMIDSKTDKHHQVILSNWLSLRHIILNQIFPCWSANKICNGPATWSILISHYAWGPVTTFNGFPKTPMIRPLDESQGSSPIQGRGSWLMCEVALRIEQDYHNGWH